MAPEIIPKTDRTTYLHYHILEVRVDGPQDLFKKDAVFAVYKEGSKVETVGGRDYIKLSFCEKSGHWKGIFPVPWAAQEGIYVVKYAGKEDIKSWPGVFMVHTRRHINDLDKTLKVMTLETTRRLRSFDVAPPGEKEGVGYKGMFEWIKYIGGNTLWYIAAQTASYSPGDLTYDYPWLKDNLEYIDDFARGTKESGLDFGAWIVSFRAFGIFSLMPERYDYSYGYRKSDKSLYKTHGISILDYRRHRDIIKMARRLNEMEDIDYIGLDYIRPAPASAGLELVDDFVEAMEIEIPGDWDEYKKEKRMKWLGEKLSPLRTGSGKFRDMWNWWRASRMAKIIKKVKNEARINKPFWVFVLSWDKGHEHGQDAVMFHDAGADIVSVMMYETDRMRFNYFVESWNDYLKNKRLNILVGNQIDWPVHQYSAVPPGPEEFGSRLEKGIKKLASPQNIRGAFVNDFSRVLRGRTGPYHKEEWFAAVGRAFSSFNHPSMLELHIENPGDIINKKEFKGRFLIKNISNEKLQDIYVNALETDSFNIYPAQKRISSLAPGESAVFSYRGRFDAEPSMRMGKHMIALRAEHSEHIYFDYKYFNVKDIALDMGVELR
ncbi:MAG: hypothetical protein ACQESB_00075 [Elusimicrobiota bacterium]